MIIHKKQSTAEEHIKTENKDFRNSIEANELPNLLID